MGKIVINKNLAKYYYKFADNIFKPITTNSTPTAYSGLTPTVSTVANLRENVVTKQSTITVLDKISAYYRNINLAWFSTDANNTNPYTKGVLTNSYDFGKSITITSLTTSASATNPSTYKTSPFKLYTSTDGNTWVEAYSSDVSYSVEHLHTLNLNTRYLKMIATGDVFVNATKAFDIVGYPTMTGISDWSNDLSIIISGILNSTTRATTLAGLVTKGVITQSESDSILLINLTDRPVITSTLTNDVITFKMTNPNKLVRRYVKDTDNVSNETLYLLFPYYTSNTFNSTAHYNTTYYSYLTTTSALSKQVLSYVAISIGTTGTEDIVLDYIDNIDYIDDMDIKIKVPNTIII